MLLFNGILGEMMRYVLMKNYTINHLLIGGQLAILVVDCQLIDNYYKYYRDFDDFVYEDKMNKKRKIIEPKINEINKLVKYIKLCIISPAYDIIINDFILLFNCFSSSESRYSTNKLSIN